MSVYKISLDQVQKVSHVDQLTLLSIFNNFNMKNNFYIDLKDLLHLKKKVMDLLHFGEKNCFIFFDNQNLDLNFLCYHDLKM